MFALLTVLTAAPLLLSGYARAAGPVFENLGQPVKKPGLMGTLVGPGPEPGSERIYFNFRQDGGKLFLVSRRPRYGRLATVCVARRHGARGGSSSARTTRSTSARTKAPTPIDNGRILVFDPQHPENEIQVVGRPSETETYLWMYTIGLDGRIYGCTYGNAKLVSYDPATGALADLGVMDDTQKYTRSIATGPAGRIYLGIGYGRANVVAYNPATGAHKAILPDAYRSDPVQTVATVYPGVDGNVYVQAQVMDTADDGTKTPRSVTLVAKGDALEPVENPAEPVSHTTLADGRQVANATIEGTYQLVHPNGTVEDKQFTYDCAWRGRVHGKHRSLGPHLRGHRHAQRTLLARPPPRAKPRTRATPPRSAANSTPCSTTTACSTYARTPARSSRNGIPRNPGRTAANPATTPADSAGSA